MNAGHSRLEFYDIEPHRAVRAAQAPLHAGDWQHEGEVPGLDGWKFRARRLIRGMGLMNFPRYIQREGRDFFYMTLRNVLPGPALTPVDARSRLSRARATGASRGCPAPASLTRWRSPSCAPDATRPDFKVRVLPKSIPAPSPTAASGRGRRQDGGGARRGESRRRGPSLWHSAGAFWIARRAAPVADAVRLASGEAPGKDAVAALGVSDEGGMLYYLEVARPAPGPSAADGEESSTSSSRSFGCSTRLSLAQPLPLALGGDPNWAGTAVRPPGAPARCGSRGRRRRGARRYSRIRRWCLRDLVSPPAEEDSLLQKTGRYRRRAGTRTTERIRSERRGGVLGEVSGSPRRPLPRLRRVRGRRRRLPHIGVEAQRGGARTAVRLARRLDPG